MLVRAQDYNLYVRCRTALIIVKLDHLNRLKLASKAGDHAEATFQLKEVSLAIKDLEALDLMYTTYVPEVSR